MRFTRGLSASALLAILAACAVSPPDNTLAYRPGAGVVENVRAARVPLPPPGQGYQLTLRMEDGSTQMVRQDSAAFQVGDRVQVTADGRIVKTAALAAPAPAETTVIPTTPAPTTAA